MGTPSFKPKKRKKPSINFESLLDEVYYDTIYVLAKRDGKCPECEIQKAKGRRNGEEV